MQGFETYFPVPRPRDPYNQVRPAIASNLPQELRKWSNERFYDAGDDFDPINIGTGLGDRSGVSKTAEIDKLASIGHAALSWAGRRPNKLGHRGAI